MDSLVFGPWIGWLDRRDAQACGSPGVYVLGSFKEMPTETADPSAAEIIYVGETCFQSLAGRWDQFARSAFEQKSGHSGGWTFSKTFCGDQTMPAPDWLYVAAAPIRLAEPHGSAFIRYSERRLIWEYVQRHGRMPVCNRK